MDCQRGLGGSTRDNQDLLAVNVSTTEQSILTDSTEVTNLLQRFNQEPFFIDIIQALADLDQDKPIRDKRRARHHAHNFFPAEGKLWRVANSSANRAHSRLECVTRDEARDLAYQEHKENGHWGHDLVKLKLMDKIFCPRLDRVITDAILDCGQCKNFGATHLHSLLEPIVRRHPFELFVADYLALPKGKGGYSNVLLIIDVYSQYVWGFKLKTHGTAKTTISGLDKIRQEFTKPEKLMTDGGKHFDNKEVADWCEAHDVERHVAPAYAPWVNGLVEGANRILLGRLKRACAPDLGEDDSLDVLPETIPKGWSDHFDTAISQLNERIIPALKFSPKELMLGLVVDTPRTPFSSLLEPITNSHTQVHSAYVAQQRTDALANNITNTLRRKAAFNRRVLASDAGEIVFNTGQLVQTYASDIDGNFATARKILPRWSAPRRVIRKRGNSYQLSTLEGFPMAGWFHARRLRLFLPRTGSMLEEMEKERVGDEEKESIERDIEQGDALMDDGEDDED